MAFPPAGERRCKGINSSGTQCQRIAKKSGYCFFHDPSLSEESSSTRSRISENLQGNSNALGNKGGRPTLYKPEYADLAYKFSILYRDVTNEKLAELFDVSIATISNWKKDYPEFLDAVKRGGKQAVAEVATSLYKRSIGYEHEAEKIFYDSKEGKVIRASYTEKYPPDTSAAKLFLVNKAPEEWRDKVTVEIDDPKKVLSELLGIGEEEIPE